jgi:uncharacterized protein
MNSRIIQRIVEEGQFSHPFSVRKLVETHISYVILGTSFAYKFKKEIKYSFLDFSTLGKRKFYCEQEVLLNNRFSKGVYLKVVPVRLTNSGIRVDGRNGEIIDYAVKMKRLRENKQMHVMLDKKQVTKDHIRALAVMIRKFHERATVIHRNFNAGHFATRFNDILSVSDFVKGALGAQQATIIKKAIHSADLFLRQHQDLFLQRVKEGHIRDCHGDLHARNIFLYHPPILFDCLEFNDEFRQIDVLDELAFFCMDLEAEGYYALSKAFIDFYFAKTKNEFGRPERLLFTYYKCYRANVRAKVNALRAMSAEEPIRQKRLDDVKKYLVLMDGYLASLSEMADDLKRNGKINQPTRTNLSQ